MATLNNQLITTSSESSSNAHTKLKGIIPQLDTRTLNDKNYPQFA